MSQITRAASKAKFETGDRPTGTDFSNLHDSVTWYDESAQDVISLLYSRFGSQIKAEPISHRAFQSLGNTGNLTSQRVLYCMDYLPNDQVINGVAWLQVTGGNYTASNYNGVGLYTINETTGLLTQVATCANDGNIWKATSATVGKKAFTSTYTATKGFYVVAAVYSSSAVVTAPILTSNATVNSFIHGLDFTNGIKLHGFINTQTALPATQLMSGLTLSTNQAYFALY